MSRSDIKASDSAVSGTPRVQHRAPLTLVCALLTLIPYVFLGIGPTRACADGDPASDVLLAENVFYPYQPKVSRALEVALEKTLQAAVHRGRSPPEGGHHRESRRTRTRTQLLWASPGIRAVPRSRDLLQPATAATRRHAHRLRRHASQRRQCGRPSSHLQATALRRPHALGDPGGRRTCPSQGTHDRNPHNVAVLIRQLTPRTDRLQPSRGLARFSGPRRYAPEQLTPGRTPIRWRRGLMRPPDKFGETTGEFPVNRSWMTHELVGAIDCSRDSRLPQPLPGALRPARAVAAGRSEAALGHGHLRWRA